MYSYIFCHVGAVKIASYTTAVGFGLLAALMLFFAPEATGFGPDGALGTPDRPGPEGGFGTDPADLGFEAEEMAFLAVG